MTAPRPGTTDIPKAAIDAVAVSYHRLTCKNPIGHNCTQPLHADLAAARTLLEAAEQAWPHQPPSRDPHSTTSCGTDRRTTKATRDPGTPPPPVSARPFGFGPPDVTA